MGNDRGDAVSDDPLKELLVDGEQLVAAGLGRWTVREPRRVLKEAIAGLFDCPKQCHESICRDCWDHLAAALDDPPRKPEDD